MRRPRGPGGRFLTAEEVAQMESQGQGGEDGANDFKGEDAATTNGTGSAKRKAENMNGGSGNETESKKAKNDDDDDGGDDDDNFT